MLRAHPERYYARRYIEPVVSLTLCAITSIKLLWHKTTVTFYRLASFNYQKPALRGLVRLDSGN